MLNDMNSGCRPIAAKYIRRQAKQLAAQLEGVRAADDIEFVHRARVAARRLRAAFEMFGDCFPRKRIRRWRKAIRRTAAKLGNARDRDVQVEMLCGVLATLAAKECFPGISRILVQLERDRERLQSKVVKAVDRFEALDVLPEMQRATRRILRKSAKKLKKRSDPVTCHQAGKHILTQLDDLLCHQESLGNPDDHEQHHAMRIATKRLRYTLEIARPVYPGRLNEAIGAIKRVQSLLGAVHDCDVWIEDLDAFASAERMRITSLFGHPGRLARLQSGIDYLRRDRCRHREEAFGELVAFWAELARRRFWEELVDIALHPGAKQPIAASPPAEAHPKPSKTNADLSAPAGPTTRPEVEPTTDEACPVPRKPLLTAGV